MQFPNTSFFNSEKAITFQKRNQFGNSEFPAEGNGSVYSLVFTTLVPNLKENSERPKIILSLT